ncbi:MAG TPA: DUF302 domain-containing protein [Caulobacteraceae bacterium]|jgi:uncharacterized protein (DUF302 family)|nr:DUF302 domain-containing protein [Caulobacteraceae bacterium]
MTVQRPPPGMTIVASEHGPKETAARLVAALTARGVTVISRVNHAAGAAGVGLSLRPTELIVFGNPLVGTPVMQAAQTAGIDLPLRALVWQDEAGKTWIGYDAPDWIAERHGIESGVDATLEKMAETLAAISRHAASHDPG